ncbi:MAG: glycosyltransferase family 4 protein [SAR324 cluster bacterium]|nr:glycosyltransferase family 4 protein [SAR324 cluster bacterium]
MSVTAVAVLDYPRLSETFVAQEILALEARGLEIQIVALRKPPERFVSPISRQIRAPVLYLPKFPHREPLRVLRAWWAVRRLPAYRQARTLLWRHFMRSPGPDPLLRFIQGLVLAHELDARVTALHAHFIYYPATVIRYTALLRALPWSCSAHARDVWTTAREELREKLSSCRWAVTCTDMSRDYLQGLAPPGRVLRVYHGLQLERFPTAPARGAPVGNHPEAPVVLLSVGRAVEKKGYADLLRALALLPTSVHWRFIHIGGGIMLGRIKKLAARMGLEHRISWLGPQPPEIVLENYRQAHIFALACKIAGDGDRDGLPNVLLEAQSQRLPVVSTALPAIQEFIAHGGQGLLVPPGDPEALAQALLSLIRDPARRERMGQAGERRLRREFAFEQGMEVLAEKFGDSVSSMPS